mgnify:CR=1 FL=1
MLKISVVGWGRCGLSEDLVRGKGGFDVEKGRI